MAQRPTRQEKDDRILHKSATANEIRTPNYAYSMEPTKELILVPMVGSPTIPETKRYVTKLRAVASAMLDDAAAIDQLADETVASMENWPVSVDSRSRI